jgi:hypothetical protein
MRGEFVLHEKRAVVVTDSDDDPSGVGLAQLLGYKVDVVRKASAGMIAGKVPDLVLFDWSPCAVEKNAALVEELRSVSATRCTPIVVLYSDERDLSREVLAASNLFAFPLWSAMPDVIARALGRAGDEELAYLAVLPSQSPKTAAGIQPPLTAVAVKGPTSNRSTSIPGIQSWLLDRVRAICATFSEVIGPLARRRTGKAPFLVEDEYDVQDLLHFAFRSVTEDVRVEEPGPSFAGAGSLRDFYLPAIQTVVETKRVRDAGHGRRGVADELIADKVRHREHPGCTRLICLVFDPDRHIPNVSVFRRDLEKDQGVPVLEVYVIRQ